MAEKVEIQFYKIDNITQATTKDSLYAVKGGSENSFKLYITDLGGNLIPLFTSSGGGITNLTSTDSSISIIGSAVKDLKISQTLQNLINSALQSNDPISYLLNDAGYLTLADLSTLENPFTNKHLIKVSAEIIPSYTPIAIYNNLAYRLDASNPLHQFAFAGFSVNGVTIGQDCKIQQIGELELIGWGLTPNAQYLAGTAGTMVTNNITPNNFTKVIGYATTANTLQIIKDFSTVN